MEELKRPNFDPQKKRVLVNIGKVRGGGIGDAILLGGALATAAFASTFIFGRKRRSGSRDNGHRNTHTPPPPAAVNKEDGRDIEGNKKECSTFLDANKQSSEATEKIGLKNDNQSLVLYEKHRAEINGVAVCDSETSEQVLCSITPKRLEDGVISSGGASHLPAREEKTLLPLEIEKTTAHDSKIQSSGEAAIDENGNTKECKDFEEVEAEGESKGAREIELMGKFQGVKCDYTEESNGNYMPEIGLQFKEGSFVPEKGKDGQESGLPVVGSLISKHGNVNDDEKQDYLSREMVEIIHDGEAIQQDEEDQPEQIEEHLVEEREKCDEPDEEIVPVKWEEDLVQDQQDHIDEAIQQDEYQLQHIEENLVQEHQKCNEPDEEIVPVKGEEEKEDQQREGNIEEKGYIDDSTQENRQLGDSGKEDVQIFVMHLPEDDPIFPEEMEVSEGDEVNGETKMSFCQHKDTEDEVEKNIENEVAYSSQTIDTGFIATAKDEEDIVDGTYGEEDLSDEAGSNTEGTVDTSMEFNLGGVWPAEAIQEPSIEAQQEKLVDQEIEGKIREDTTLKRGKYELHPNKIIADNTHATYSKCNSAKTFIQRHVADLATLKDYSTNSGKRKVLLVAISVLSSVSCSWFFGLSFDKFCFVVLLTIVLSKSMSVE